MKYFIKPGWLLLFTNILAVAQTVYLFPRLPSKVAIRFNNYGIAESFTNKLFFVSFELLVVFSLTLFVIIISKYLHKLPYGLINIPYKRYWLSENNKRICFRIISGQLIKIIAITNLLLMSMYQIIANASINASYKLIGNSWWLIIAYLIVVSFNIVKMYKYFSNHDMK